MEKPRTTVEKFWKDKDGKQAIVDWPNIPLVGWLIFTLVGKFIRAGRLQNTSEYLAFGFLFTWAWLEVYSGKSYFRRILGLLVFVVMLTNKLK